MGKVFKMFVSGVIDGKTCKLILQCFRTETAKCNVLSSDEDAIYHNPIIKISEQKLLVFMKNHLPHVIWWGVTGTFLLGPYIFVCVCKSRMLHCILHWDFEVALAKFLQTARLIEGQIMRLLHCLGFQEGQTSSHLWSTKKKMCVHFDTAQMISWRKQFLLTLHESRQICWRGWINEHGPKWDCALRMVGCTVMFCIPCHLCIVKCKQS